MRIVKIAAVALLLGLAGGTALASVRGSREILAAREAERADSLARIEAAAEADRPAEEGGADEEDGVEEEPATTGGAGPTDDGGLPARPAAGGGGEALSAGSAPADVAPAAPSPETGGDVGALPPEAVGGVAAAPAGGLVRPPEPGAAPDAEASRKLAKIFGAMRPGSAAAVLQEMSDVEVEAILLNMSDRKAAEILGAFEPGRAADLSRTVLAARGGDA